jgi:hypothetical protein
VDPAPAHGASVRDRAAPGEDSAPPDAPASPSAHPRWLPALVVGAFTVVLAIPLLVALGVLARPRWVPILDLAQTELRVRDVGSSTSPLIGLAGRIIGPDGQQGSHPGPLSFWALAPFYRAFGASSWAMQAAAVVLHALALATSIWIAFRRGGLRLALALTAVLAILTTAYGPATLTEAWNPYLPVLWWVAFLLAVWSVLCDDLPMLPVAVFAGSFCAQTHVPYLGSVAGLSALVVGVLGWRAWRARGGDRAARRRLLRWALIALGVGVVVWLPPVIDELTNSPGNLSVLWDYFRNPPESPIGPQRGIELLLRYLNPARLLTWRPVAGQEATEGSIIPGVLVLGVWVASAVVAWRLRFQRIVRLDVVLAAALVLGAISTSRIFGTVFFYLALWAWGIAALVLLAIGWTAVRLVSRSLSAANRDRAGHLLVAVLAVVVVAWVAMFTVDASRAEVPRPRLVASMRTVMDPTVDALGASDGRALVTWSDPVSGDARGYALVNELDREGVDVAVEPEHSAGATPDRVLEHPTSADTEVHLAVGPDISTWRKKPGARQVVAFDPRTPREQLEYARLRSEAIERLRAAGLGHLVPNIDESLMALPFEPNVPRSVLVRVSRMVDLGLPVAVFVRPAA